MKRILPFMGIAAGIAVIGGLLWFAFAPVEIERSDGSAATADSGPVKYRSNGKRQRLPRADVKGGNVRKGRQGARQQLSVAPDWYAKLPSAADRALAKRIQDAQDADDHEAMLAAAEEARKSQCVEVRQAAVETLSLLDAKAIPLLKTYIQDSNSDVAEDAYNAWDSAVDCIEYDHARINAIKEVLPVIKDDKQLDRAAEKFVMLDQPRAMRELSAMASGGDKRISAAAKKAYETVAGEPFESWAAAELKVIAIERENKAYTSRSQK